ncbi:sugar phosphate isomerase/epimerase [soil metagenome]
MAGVTLLSACATAGSRAVAAPPRPWGVQLFTVLPLIEKDIEGTLKAVATLGYKEVETIGSFGRDPAYVRSLLDRFGLVSPSQHIASDFLYLSFSQWSRREITTEQNRANYVATLQPENVERLVEGAIAQAKVLGQHYVVWPILMAPHLETRELVDRFTAAFNRGGEMCAKEGLNFAYHNHALEFAKLGNDVIYDVILKQTDPKLVKLELDFYWVSKAGADPLTYLAANKGRYRMAHVKDMTAAGDFAVVGGGIIDLPKLINAARVAGVEHFYVEYDRSVDPMREISESITYLSALPR